MFEDDAYADRAFPAAAAGLDPRDRALAQRLAYGTVQRVRTLDHGIEALGRRPVAKLDPPVRAALRLGAYQLAFSEVAVHAAVNESVELVRAAGLERAVSFANAVLRRLALGLRDLVDALPSSTAAQAALRHSYPDWVAELWWRELGRDEALALMAAQNEPPETVVRLNPRRPGAVEGTPDPEIPCALHVERVDEEALRDGRIWPQSRGSQLAGLCVGSREGERVLDLCAAPGGKATQVSTTCSSTRPARASAFSRPGPTCAGGPGRYPTSSAPCCGSRQSECAQAGRFSTRSARSPPRRTRPSSTLLGSRSSRSGGSGRGSLIRGGPSSC